MLESANPQSSSPPQGNLLLILPPNSLTLRPATSEDAPRVYEIKVAAFRVYAEQAWGPWDEEFQARLQQERYDPAVIQMILVHGREIGWINIELLEGELWLVNIHLLPEFQNQGIGTHLITQFLHDAKQRNLPARLRVLKVNTRARKLYERLGFETVSETDTHYNLQHLPQDST
jgi:ribosomal protein S18 acetylase RimI-like enzyme